MVTLVALAWDLSEDVLCVRGQDPDEGDQRGCVGVHPGAEPGRGPDGGPDRWIEWGVVAHGPAACVVGVEVECVLVGAW